MSKFDELLQLLHKGKNPYSGFPTAQWLGAWYGDPGANREIIKRQLDAVKPTLIIEVGSFVGESAIVMAQHLKAHKRDAVIICCDTWLAGFDHYKGAPEKLNPHFGRVDLYYRFLANVIDRGCSDMIVPFPMDSINAARVLGWLKVQADFCYIDASHEEGDVLRDYEAYWPLIRSGGVMVADDISNHFPGVVKDWEKFLAEHKLKAIDVQGEKQAVSKP